VGEQEWRQIRIEYYIKFLGRASHIVGRFSGIEKFEGKRENFIFNTFIYFNKEVKKFKNRSGVGEFGSFDDSVSKGILDLLETIIWDCTIES